MEISSTGTALGRSARFVHRAICSSHCISSSKPLINKLAGLTRGGPHGRPVPSSELSAHEQKDNDQKLKPQHRSAELNRGSAQQQQNHSQDRIDRSHDASSNRNVVCGSSSRQRVRSTSGRDSERCCRRNLGNGL